MRSIPPATVDAILTLQLLVAWAGEGARLGWWRTNLVDPDAGLDLLTRLAPRTAEVAAWELVRAAAIAEDAKRRAQQADGERLITLFALGVDVDEALADRLHDLKTGSTGMKALAALPTPGDPFDRAALTTRLSALGAVDTDARTAGRRIKGDTPVGPDVRAKRLAAALVPLADHYPMPYFAP